MDEDIFVNYYDLTVYRERVFLSEVYDSESFLIINHVISPSSKFALVKMCHRTCTYVAPSNVKMPLYVKR